MLEKLLDQMCVKLDNQSVAISKEDTQGKVGAHAVAVRSCGRSSPVALAFEPVVVITLGHRATVTFEFPQITFSRLP